MRDTIISQLFAFYAVEHLSCGNKQTNQKWDTQAVSPGLAVTRASATITCVWWRLRQAEIYSGRALGRKPKRRLSLALTGRRWHEEAGGRPPSSRHLV